MMYQQVANPAFTDSADYPAHCAELAKWRDEMPDSPTPLVALAKAHIDWAWQARGSGYAGTVTEEGWQQFHTRIAEARSLLERAEKLGPQDAEAHRQLLVVAMAEGLSDEQARTWFDAGRKIDPWYSPLYTQMATLKMPRWGGAPGDVERFAAEAAELMPGDDGLALFGLIAYEIHRYECDDPTTVLWGDYDRELLAKAVDALAKRYPHSQGAVQFAALCSVICQDHKLAQRIRPLVGEYDRAHKIWAWQNTHKQFLRWAEATEIPGGEESTVWSSLAGCVAMSFADDSRHIWAGHQFGRRSVTLVDSQTGKIRLALPHPGGVVNNVAFDQPRKRVLLSAWNGPLVGWTLFDFANPTEPITFSTTEQVLTIAVNPQKPQVAWAEAKALRLLDLTSEKAEPIGLDIPFAHQLVYSPDGTRLAAGSHECFICDAASGQVLFKLPSMRLVPRPAWIYDEVLDFDAEGRIWAITRSTGPGPQKRALVRLSADGKVPETMLPDIGMGRAALSPGRNLLAITRDTGVNSGPCGVEIFDVARAKSVKRLGGHWIPIGMLRFSPDGQKLATIARLSDVIKIWSLEGIAAAPAE